MPSNSPTEIVTCIATSHKLCTLTSVEGGRSLRLEGIARSVDTHNLTEFSSTILRRRKLSYGVALCGMGKVRSLDSSLVLSGPQLAARGRISLSTQRLLFLVWMSIGVAPLLLQARSYVRFVTPHKISRSLLPPDTDVQDTTDLFEHCPVEGLGTYDSNGVWLAYDRGSTEYRESYWYGLSGSVWIAYRILMLRRSYISCKRYGKRCDRMCEGLRLNDAVVYVQESMRLSAYDARNFHRVALLYLLVEGLMGDLFLLIAQEGIIGRLQYISLGYNLSGVMSMLFEIVETMHWLGERIRILIKRLLFNYETMLLGECICAAAMQRYLTALNRSKGFKHSDSASKFLSPYVWSLVGHGVIVLGCVLVLVTVRSLGAIIYMRIKYGCFAILGTSCCVDTTLGIRGKLVVLGGYAFENRKLYYKLATLKAFG
ncbi:hypothetical protein GQ600_10363 [Phytophthora cactorum]|nr:hypothetical protein GQ600_10363 [Phytophthora cactorum]